MFGFNIKTFIILNYQNQLHNPET